MPSDQWQTFFAGRPCCEAAAAVESDRLHPERNAQSDGFRSLPMAGIVEIVDNPVVEKKSWASGPTTAPFVDGRG